MIQFFQEGGTRLAGRRCSRQPVAEGLNCVNIRVTIEEDRLGAKVAMVKVEMLSTLSLAGRLGDSNKTIILRHRSQVSFTRRVNNILEDFADRNGPITVHVGRNELNLAELIMFWRRAAHSLKLRQLNSSASEIRIRSFRRNRLNDVITVRRMLDILSSLARADCRPLLESGGAALSPDA